MSGQRVPLVMVPRYTSYVGPNEFTTVPLDVSEYAKAVLTLWRGELVGDDGSTISAVFETSQDAKEWSPAHVAIESAPGSDILDFELEDRWLRFRIVLVTPGHEVGITCWAAGSLEMRISGG